MKRLAILLCLCSALVFSAELSAVHTVYLLPMGSGLDQYLANRLTGEHVFQVVTDPKLADAVFTDRIGQAFQAQLDSLLPPPSPPPAPKSAAKDAKSSKSDEEKAPLLTDTVNKLDNPAMNSNFGRGKGNVFLVDMKSRQVLWSIFEPSKDSRNTSLDHTASDIVSRLKKDLGGKK